MRSVSKTYLFPIKMVRDLTLREQRTNVLLLFLGTLLLCTTFNLISILEYNKNSQSALTNADIENSFDDFQPTTLDQLPKEVQSNIRESLSKFQGGFMQSINSSYYYLKSSSITIIFETSRIILRIPQFNNDKVDINEKKLHDRVEIDSISEVILTFPGSNQVFPIAFEPQKAKYNFFKGNPNNWIRDAPFYRKIIYSNLYANIDLVYEINNGELKYEFLVHPDGDYKDIELQYTGDLSINNSEDGLIFRINTVNGEFVMGDSNPINFVGLGRTSIIKGNFDIRGENSYGFEIEDYDNTEELIIDPIIKLDFSTFIGGTGLDRAEAVALDSENNIYITGYTGDSITDYPTTNGALNETINLGHDVFVSKLSANGSYLLFSSFIGGDQNDEGFGLVLDLTNNIYLTGRTNGGNFPTTLGAYDISHNGLWDVFVVKLSNDGSSLNYSTFLGGSGHDMGVDITIDNLNNTYITGSTSDHTIDFPTTSGVLNETHNGNDDIFVAKLSSDGSTLISSTFIGGSGNEGADGIFVDSFYAIYVTGDTIDATTDYPTTPAAYNTSLSGLQDVFVTKLSSDFGNLIFSTFLGGSKTDLSYDIQVDNSLNIFIAGSTDSPNFPTTFGAYSNSLNGVASDVFVTKLSPDGSSLIFSTYIGGSGPESALAMTLDNENNPYITGYTYDSIIDYPTTEGAYDVTPNAQADVFVTKLTSNGSNIEFSTLIGGSEIEVGNAIVIDTSKNVIITGYSYEGVELYPTTSNAFDTTHNSHADVIVTKFLIQEFDKPKISGSRDFTATNGSFGNYLNWTIGDYNPSIYNITLNGALYIADTVWTNDTITISLDGLPIGVYTFTIHVYDKWDNLAENSIVYTVTKFDQKNDIWFSSVVGGSNYDWGYAIALDLLNNIYVAGSTVALDSFPITPGAFDGRNGVNDGFVSKFSSDGTSLIFSTIIGGSGVDEVFGVFVDVLNYVYITGQSYDHTIDFPTTSGAYNDSNNGDGDVFISKFSPNGSILIFSTLIGGAGRDSGEDIIVDSAGNIYVTGWATKSTYDFPTTSGAYDETHNLGVDAFILKLSINGSTILFSTYLGGQSSDIAYAIVLDSNENPVITGTTNDAYIDYPTQNALDPTHNGNSDVFISQLSSDGSELLFSTFLGGSSTDIAYDIAIDEADNVFITGETRNSTKNFPTTLDAYNRTHGGNLGTDVFVAKVSLETPALIFSTLIGGAGTDIGYAIDVDAEGFVYVAGVTEDYLNPYPTTENAVYSNPIAYEDAFISKFSRDGTTLLSSSYFGTIASEQILDIVLISSNSLVTTGVTWDGSNFITTSGAYDETYNGLDEVFVSRFTFEEFDSPEVSLVGGLTHEFGISYDSLSWNVYDEAPNTYNISKDGLILESQAKWSSGSVSINITGLAIGTYNYSIQISDYWGNISNQTVTIEILDTTPAFVQNRGNQIFEYTSTGNQLFWEVGDVDPNIYNITLDDELVRTNIIWSNGTIFLPVDGLDLGDHLIILSIVDASGNILTDTVIITVSDTTPPELVLGDDISYELGSTGNHINLTPTDPDPSSYIILRNGTQVNTGNWNSSEEINFDVDGLSNGIYNFTILVYDGSGNVNTASIFVDVIDTISPEIISFSNTLGNQIDLVYEYGTTGNSLTWVATDLDPGSYTIYHNETLLREGIWTSSTPISVTVNGYVLGIHNLTIQFVDGTGNRVEDTRLIQVVDTIKPIISLDENSKQNPNVIAGGSYTLLVQDYGYISYIEYQWNDGDIFKLFPDQLSLTFNQELNSFYFTIPVPLELAETDATLSIYAYDESGNMTPIQFHITILSELPNNNPNILNLNPQTILIIAIICISLILSIIVFKTVRRSGGRKYGNTPIPMENVVVFISYSSKDTKVAEHLYDALYEINLNPWIALDNIAIGEQYNEEIIRAIDSSKIFIILVTKNSVGSRHVGTELERAFSKNKKLFPVRLDNVQLPVGWEYFLSQSQWKDYSDEKKTDWVYELATMIEQHVKPFRETSSRSTDGGHSSSSGSATTPSIDSAVSKTSLHYEEVCLFCDTIILTEHTSCPKCGQFDPFLKRPLKRGEKWTTCYNCFESFHRGTFLEWLRTNGRCPSCKERVQENRYTEYLTQSEVTQKIKAIVAMDIGIKQDDLREINQIERSTVKVLDELQKIYHIMMRENEDLRKRMDKVELTASESQDKVLAIIQPIAEEIVRVSELSKRMEADLLTQDQFDTGIEVVTQKLYSLEDQVDLLLEYHRRENSMRKKLQDKLKDKTGEIEFDVAMEETGIKEDLSSYGEVPTKFKLHSIIGKIKYGLQNSVGDPKKWLKLTSLLFFI